MNHLKIVNWKAAEGLFMLYRIVPQLKFEKIQMCSMQYIMLSIQHVVYKFEKLA